MQLPVLPKPWYADGLNFTCTQCGNCCTGAPGSVWITKEEIARLAEHLKLSAKEVIQKYCHRLGGKLSLQERRNPSHGGYDCIFLKDDGSHRSCTIYPVRPLQCRTWPFWSSTLATPKAWETAAKRCHGMNQGRRFSLAQIKSVRDANEWPVDGPTSDANANR
jgi:Fe-S-cluster containining protein